MKELIDALHVIQDECKKHDMECTCKNCMLFKAEGCTCAVTERMPRLWEINDKIHRALL